MSIEEFFTEMANKNRMPISTPYTIWKVEDENKLKLIEKGQKRASSFLKDYFDDEFKESEYKVVVDVNDNPIVLLHIDKVYETDFSSVRLSHAYLEGENDRMLSSWRNNKKLEFNEILKQENKEVEDETKVICIEYHKIK